MRDLCYEEVEKNRHTPLWTEVVIPGGTSTPHILSTLEIPKSLADHTRPLQFGGFVIENACQKSSWIKVKRDNKYDGIWTLWFLCFLEMKWIFLVRRLYEVDASYIDIQIL